MSEANTTAAKGHPPALYMLFATEMWERFSYYGMRGLLILYLTKSMLDKGLNWSDGHAGLIYGLYTGLVYLTPVLGGWLADNFLGQRRSIFIGGMLMMLGQFSLFLEAAPIVMGTNNGQDTIMYATTILGLLLLIVGNGFFKPNISTMVGDLYPAGDARRDRAFTIFYMGINLGAFLAPLVCGFLGETYGFRWGFLSAGVGMGIGQIIYMLNAPRMLGNIGVEPSAKRKNVDGAQPVKAPLTKIERDRVNVILILIGFVTFFWAGFEQAGSSLSLYTDKFVNRVVMGFEIPTSAFQSVNPLFIVALGPVFTILWTVLSRRGKEPSTPVKMAWGMILLGVGFIMMVFAVLQRGGDIPDPAIKASFIWLLLTYLFHTMGELCLSPIGLSMVSRLAPLKLASVMMGSWFLSSFIANLLSGLVVGTVETMGALSVFSIIAGFVIVLGLLLLVLARKLNELMHNDVA